MLTKARPRIGGDTFGAIADPTRRAILDLLRGGELSAGELAARFPVSRPAIARHVSVLRRARLLTERRQAQSRIYALHPAALAEIDQWLAPYRTFWAARLLALKQVVEAQVANHASTAISSPDDEIPR